MTKEHRIPTHDYWIPTTEYNVLIKSRQKVCLGEAGEGPEWPGLKQNWSKLSSLFDGVSQQHPR